MGERETTPTLLLIVRCYKSIKKIKYSQNEVKMIKENLGKKLKILRKKEGISQEAFALRIGMDRTYYASVEAGKRNISIINLKKISDGFNVSLSELFQGVL